MRYDGKTTRRKLKKLRIDEISLVDTPAHGPATVAIMKRAADTVAVEPVQKKMALTSLTAGHAHSIIMVQGSSEGLAELRAGQTSYADGHMHDWIMDDAGNIILADAEGHSHGIAALVMKYDETLDEGELAALAQTDIPASSTKAADRGAETTNMTPEEKAAFEKAAADQLNIEKARADRAELIVKLSPSQRAHFDALPAEGQDEFLKSEDKDAIVKNAESSDPVVHVDLDGNEYRKSADPVVLRLVKSNDDLRKQALAAEQTAKRAGFEKRAGEELGHLTGELAAKADLLTAVDSLPTEKRAPVLAILKSKDAGLAKAFEAVGTSDEGSDAPSIDAQLDTLAKSIGEKNPELTPEQAYVKALTSPEGQALHAQR